MRVVCVIPSSCSTEVTSHLKKCLTSVTKSANKIVDLKIVVVTNNLSVSKNFINSKVSMLEVVPESWRFVQMNNKAIEMSLKKYNPDYVLLINDDAWIEKNFFLEFRKTVQTNPVEIVVPLIQRAQAKSKIDSYGIEYYKSGYARNSHNLHIETTLAAAACIVVKTDLLKQIKRNYGFYFNPLLDSYFEDIEFSIRALGVGAKIQKNKLMIVNHYGSLSYSYGSDYVVYQTFRNLLWTLFLTWPIKYVVIYGPYIILVQTWFIFCTIRDKQAWVYPKLINETYKSFSKLITYRKISLKGYDSFFEFKTVFSKYIFRTRKSGMPI